MEMLEIPLAETMNGQDMVKQKTRAEEFKNLIFLRGHLERTKNEVEPYLEE